MKCMDGCLHFVYDVSLKQNPYKDRHGELARLSHHASTLSSPLVKARATVNITAENVNFDSNAIRQLLIIQNF